MLDKNSELRKELFVEGYKSDSIVNAKNTEISSLKRTITLDVFNKQMDTLNADKHGKLNRQFYERTINSAALLDSI